MNRREFLYSAAAATAATRAGLARPSAPLAEFGYSDVQFPDGPHQQQLEQTHAILMGLSEDSVLKPFRDREGLPAPGDELGGWYSTNAFAPAAQFGQWVSALARYYAITRDPATKAKVSSLVQGYAATISPQGKFFIHNRFPSYTYDKLVLGLIDANSYAGDPAALSILARTTSAANPYLPPHSVPRMTRQLTSEEEFSIHGWDESYTMGENLFLAAERTGRPLYRDMAVRFLPDQDFFDPLAKGQDVLAGRHAYSHMNALSSAAKAYLVLGDDKYLRAARNGFDFVQRQSFATGGWGPDELFSAPGSGDLGASLEKTHAGFETPCGAYAHFKLTRYLLRITQDSRYGDSMEKVMYNTVLGAKPMDPSGSAFYYSDYHSGGRKTYHPDKWPCCSGTLPQIAADYRVSTYFRDGRGVFVNLFIPSTLRWTQGDTRMSLTQSGPYPRAGQVQINVTAEKPVDCALRFRIPAWAESPSLSINGSRQTGELRPGTFAAIERTWKSGDRVEIELPSARRLEPVDAEHPDLVALVKGPLMLFSLAEKTPELSRRQLLQDDLAKGDIRFLPFMEISDQAYCTYQKLAREGSERA
jgi:DUF1680 family protein